ncbi:helix-turn-helix domain-containing protein [Robertkochia solimangrovi]|uniref:helix-turn-helix domain-containing protein n=1 Tax=Robertkochia solimangrovi TaxID=2213046 RepID=UPI00117D40DC|nr:helix-turn-helix domain-containing protein [Robertkochia solimangrovi]TRZ43703.1 hypothetical protein DMZ48_09850 [Robertkochia solimangrovi]
MAVAGDQSQNAIFLQKLKMIILENLENEDFSVEELAELIGLSRSQLHRKLKSQRGLSISQFIREVRLEEALKMLKKDVATTSEIAYRCGFNSPSYFHKCFHKYFGYTPGEIKDHFRNQIADEEYNPLSDTGSDQSSISPAVKSETISLPVKTPEIDFGYFRGKRKLLWLFMSTFIILAVMSFIYLRYNATSDKRETSIAVLPFTNLSDKQENQFFADGIVEDLLFRLSKIDGFKVISRTSSDRYRNRNDKTIPQIGKELGVNYIIEGSIQRSDDHTRFNIQLIDANTDTQLWVKNFDRDMANIFDTQSEIAVNIATELNRFLSPEEEASINRHNTNNLRAFELYQLGNFELKKRTGLGYISGINFFEDAIKEDPKYARAYAGLAEIYLLMSLEGSIEVSRGRNQSEALAKRALEIDPSLAEAHTVLASIYTNIDFNWTKAEQEFRRAIALNPNYSAVYHYYSGFLSIQGKHQEARAQLNKALELDPLSFVIRYFSAHLYFNQGDFQNALAENQRCKEMLQDHPWSTWNDFEINYMLGNYDKALDAFKLYGLLTNEYPPSKADSIYKNEGPEGLLKMRIDYSEQPYLNARYYTLLGDRNKALESLQQSFDTGTPNPEISFDYFLRDLREDPRFLSILDKIGLKPEFRI